MILAEPGFWILVLGLSMGMCVLYGLVMLLMRTFTSEPEYLERRAKSLIWLGLSPLSWLVVSPRRWWHEQRVNQTREN